MKKLLVLISLSLFLLIVQAQNIGYTLKSGEPINLKGSDFVNDVRELGMINGYAYFLFLPFQRTSPNELIFFNQSPFIYKIDLKNNIVKKTELELKADKKDLQFEGVMKLKDKLFVFSSYQNTKEKKHYLFVQNFNPANCELINNAKYIAELDYSGYSKFESTAFNMVSSPDSTKVLIFYSLLTKKNVELRSGINIYDSNINLLWKNDNVTGEFTKGIFEFQQFKIDNKGTVYLLGQHFDDKSNYFDFAQFRSRGFLSNDTYFTDMPNYTFGIYRYTENQTKPEHFPLTIPQKFIRSLNFSLQENDTIFCTGMYSETGKISVKGSFCFDLNLESKTMSKPNTFEINSELLTRDLDPDELKRFKRSIDNNQEWDPYSYSLSEIKTRQNGEKYFIAEQHIEGIRESSSGNGRAAQISIERILINNDLFVVSLNTDNTFKRIDKITKRQFCLNDDKYNSYAVIEKNNALYFLYTVFEQKKALLFNFKIGDSYLTRLDMKGNQIKNVFKHKDDQLPVPVLFHAMQVTDNSLMFGSFTNKLHVKNLIQQVIITE